MNKTYKLLVSGFISPGIEINGASVMFNRLMEFLPQDVLYIFVKDQNKNPIITNNHIAWLQRYNSNGKDNIFKKFYKQFYNRFILPIQLSFRVLISISNNKGIQHLLFINDSYGLGNVLIMVVCRIKKVPYSVYIYDLWLGNFNMVYSDILGKLYEKSFYKNATNIFCVGDGIKSILYKKYHLQNLLVTHNSINIDNLLSIPKVKCSTHTKLMAVFAGNIYWAQKDALIIFLQACAESNSNIYLDIYTNQESYYWNDIKSRVNVYSNWNAFDLLSEDEIHKKYIEYDLCFLPLLSNDKQHKEIINTAEPGKLIDYMASGKPIFAVTSEDAYLYRYIKDNHIGFVCDPIKQNLQLYLQTIEQQLKNYNNSLDYTHNAFNILIANHSARTNAMNLYSKLIK